MLMSSMLLPIRYSGRAALLKLQIVVHWIRRSFEQGSLRCSSEECCPSEVLKMAALATVDGTDERVSAPKFLLIL